ncbi:MAG: DUF971 domain-containing protein [Pseudomonadota bacterium]|nr:DUF971 domain-containing protein [Pseudomonadota bacterium]
MDTTDTPRLTALTLHRASRVLEATFDNGEVFQLPCEYLRVFSPSAEVRGHGAGPGLLVAGKESVNIRAIEPTGHYAVRLVFDDGHDSGIYTFAQLYALGKAQSTNWDAYLARLQAAGYVRKPQP